MPNGRTYIVHTYADGAEPYVMRREARNRRDPKRGWVLLPTITEDMVALQRGRNPLTERKDHAMPTTTGPKVSNVKRYLGVAGEYGYRATVQYPEEAPSIVAFQSSVYGPPIVMLTDGLPGGVFVSRRVLDRIGTTLDAAWVDRFFA